MHTGYAGVERLGHPDGDGHRVRVGVVSLLGSRVPVQLKLFLLTLAVADDFGGIGVIAIFYSDGLAFGWLAGAFAVFLGMYLLRRLGVWWFPLYVVLGVVAWYFMLRSGVHATIAGVVIGFLTPTKPLRPGVEAETIADRLENQPELSAADVKNASFLIRESVPVDERLMDMLHPWTGFLIIPVFALANAAIPLNATALVRRRELEHHVGSRSGLVLGKTIGVTGMAWLAVKSAWRDCPVARRGFTCSVPPWRPASASPSPSSSPASRSPTSYCKRTPRSGSSRHPSRLPF